MSLNINLVFQVLFLTGTCGVQGNQPFLAAENKTVRELAFKICFFTTILDGMVYKGLIHALKREREWQRSVLLPALLL